METKEAIAQISFRVPEHLKRRFYSKLEGEGRDVTEYLTQQIQEYLLEKKDYKPTKDNKELYELVDAIMACPLPEVRQMMLDALSSCRNIARDVAQRTRKAAK